MRKITINLAAVAAFCIVVASPALVSSSCATPKTEQEDTTIIREDSGITALKYSSPEVPTSIEFCGKTIDLSRFDRHERMDERYHIEKATRAACRYLKDAYAKYKDWVAVAASYNAGQARIASQLAKQDVDDSLDLQLVEETARYVYRILAAKQLFNAPTTFGFRLRASDLYPPIPYTEITVTKGIADLARFARSKGINLAILKNMNPWLRETSLSNHSGRTYVIKIPTKEGMTYDPKKTVAHDKRWVIE